MSTKRGMFASAEPPPSIGGRRLRNVALADISIIPGRRDVRPEAVAELAESIRKLGLQEPIKLRYNETYDDPEEGEIGGALTLIAGGHRLAVCRSLGWEEIPAYVLTVSDIEARLIEIAENLHRNELALVERADQVDEWIRLTTVDGADDGGKHAQLAQVGHRGGKGLTGGLSEAARILGLDRREIDRARAIASLDEEIRKTAKACGLYENQAALVEVAKASRKEQAVVIHDIASAKSVARYRDRKARNDSGEAEVDVVEQRIRMPRELADAIDAWIAQQPDPRLNRHEVILTVLRDRFASETDRQ